ncbi:MAG TPA: response regulator [Bryobacteraceae bacterium]|nr:response regulator [Bryobacteraceae bacterium]
MTSKRILIVEDELIVARDLQNILRRLGHRMIGQVANGPDAIRMAAESRPDLILMDLVLDGSMDGLETALEIARHRQVPIIYITANSNTIVCRPSKMVFPFLCVAKPFSATIVESAIESVFSRPRPS